jgi:hypothetical protein
MRTPRTSQALIYCTERIRLQAALSMTEFTPEELATLAGTTLQPPPALA